jgi:hypothetical protein
MGFCQLEVGVARVLFILALAFALSPRSAFGESDPSQITDCSVITDGLAAAACDSCQSLVKSDASLYAEPVDPHDLYCCVVFGSETAANDGYPPQINFDNSNCGSSSGSGN